MFHPSHFAAFAPSRELPVYRWLSGSALQPPR